MSTTEIPGTEGARESGPSSFNGDDPWAPNEIDVEFPSGRVYTVRRSLPLQWFITQAMADGDLQLAEAITSVGTGQGLSGELPEDATDEQREDAASAQLALAARVMQTIVEAYFVHPKVYADPNQIPAGHATERDDRGRPLALSALDLTEGDLEFATEKALGGVSQAAGFRGESEPDEPRPEGGDGGEVLEPEPQQHDGDDPWDHELVPG